MGHCEVKKGTCIAIISFLISIFLFTATSFAAENFFEIYSRADIVDYGQPGLPRYLSLLGLPSRHTLITLDGRRVDSNINHIPIRLIENVEIKEGVSSVLDGPGVIGGSVNILTVAPGSEVPYTFLYSRWGTSGLENYGVNFRNRNGSLQYSVFADKIFCRGYGLYKKSHKYDAVNLYAKMDWYYDRKTWFTITTGKPKHFQLKYETHQPKTALKIRFYGSEDSSFVQGNEEIIEQNIGKFHLVRVGIDHHWNRDASVLSKEDAFYYEDEINLNNLTFSMGQRHDKNSLFTKERSPRLRLNYRLKDETTLFLNGGQGVSFPEKGMVWVLGFKKPLSDFASLNLTGHLADVENLTSKGVRAEILFAVGEKIDVQTMWAENKLKTNLLYRIKKYNGDLLWTVALNHEYQGEDFSTVNLDMSAKLAKAFTVNLAVNNLDNGEYSLVDGYPMPRRNFAGGIVWEFWN